ncbi:MAG TPA: ATP-binding protein [Gemmatimonadales bacterium]|jgi:two-component system NtrC family sensor kinase
MTRPSGTELSPAGDADRTDALEHVLSLARAVAGMLRPASVLDRLVQEVKASFGPGPAAVVTMDEQGHPESAKGESDHPILAPVLSEVLRTGGSAGREQQGQRACGVPIQGRRRLLGGLAVLLQREATPADFRTLEGFAAVSALALQGAYLVEAADRRHHVWEDAADAVSLALCVVDRAGRVEQGNRAFTELAGSPPGGVIGRPWAELVPDEWREPVAAVLAGTAPAEVDLSIGPRTIAVTAFTTAGAGSRRQVLLFEDQTDRRRLQDRLIQTEKLTAIGQLIAGVAHDLNNPLTSVVGFADFLAEAQDVPARIREPLRVIQQEAERASKIVKNLLSFARRQETRQPAALRPILEATIGLMRNTLSADQVALQTEIATDLPDLDLNPTQIQQVFVNLIQNAAQAIVAGGRPGTIRLKVRRWMDGAAIDVTDDGPGMEPEVAAQVFEPFFTTKPEGQGTGLGLSVSQGIVKEHGGRITLTTAPGRGATFTVELPGRVRPAELPTPPVAQQVARSLHVLVVDDEPHILHYIRATLEAWGHTVVTASDGEAGLARAIAEPFDLIISDLRMPRCGGQEFFEALLRHNPEAARRVAFSTGDTVRGDTLDFLERQGRPCLHKPFSLAELRALLQDPARG